jgi:hypothetical protein
VTNGDIQTRFIDEINGSPPWNAKVTRAESIGDQTTGTNEIQVPNICELPAQVLKSGTSVVQDQID